MWGRALVFLSLTRWRRQVITVEVAYAEKKLWKFNRLPVSIS
jgi:hypothetical protein